MAQPEVIGFMNDRGPLTDRTRRFFMYKTIQKSYNFCVMFDESVGLPEGTSLASFHATSVEIPDYSFEKESVKIGPFIKTFPVLKHEGFSFNIKFEEDDSGRIKSLINSLIRKNISSGGYYNSYLETVINRIVVDVFGGDGTNVYKVTFHNCYYLKASTPTYTFNSNEKIEYDIEFNCDHYEIIPRAGAVYKEEVHINEY